MKILESRNEDMDGVNHDSKEIQQHNTLSFCKLH